MEPLFYGIGTIFISAMLLCIPISALILSGAIPQSGLGIFAGMITAVCCFLGGYVAAKRAGKMPLPVALLAAGLYLLIGFILRGLIFGGVGSRPWIMVIVAAVAAVIGSMAAAGKKTKVKHRV